MNAWLRCERTKTWCKKWHSNHRSKLSSSGKSKRESARKLSAWQHRSGQRKSAKLHRIRLRKSTAKSKRSALKRSKIDLRMKNQCIILSFNLEASETNTSSKSMSRKTFMHNMRRLRPKKSSKSKKLRKKSQTLEINLSSS